MANPSLTDNFVKALTAPAGKRLEIFDRVRAAWFYAFPDRVERRGCYATGTTTGASPVHNWHLSSPKSSPTPATRR